MWSQEEKQLIPDPSPGEGYTELREAISEKAFIYQGNTPKVTMTLLTLPIIYKTYKSQSTKLIFIR